MAQSWNILTPAETKDAARVWLYQIRRHGVPTVYYQEILDRAIDHRIMHIAKGEKPPMLSVELLLAMFRELKADLHEKCKELDSTFRTSRQLLNQMSGVRDLGQISQFLRSAEDRYARKFSMESLKEFLESDIKDRNKQIEAFWRANHLPDEAREWLN